MTTAASADNRAATIKQPAIVILGANSLATARRIQAACPGATVYGLTGRVPSQQDGGADIAFEHFGTTIRELYESDTPIVALCAAGIVIRSIAPLLQNKRAEPPVLAVAEDGSAVVPLLGGLRGVNVLARRIAEGLGVAPAITTTGELRFGTCLLNPPPGYELRNLADGKTFISNLLAGEKVRVDGDATWLESAQLPVDPSARLAITVTPRDIAPTGDQLVFHARTIVIGLAGVTGDVTQAIDAALKAGGYTSRALACLIADESEIGNAAIHAAAAAFDRPLRFLKPQDAANPAESLARAAVPDPVQPIAMRNGIALAIAATPADIRTVGRKRGRLAVIGLGPGDVSLMAPVVKEELQRAEDILGYETYVRMAEDAAGPFRADQVRHATDNREEMQRARHAFELAASGRSVVMVSSGDPGVFAMAAAVVEALHDSSDPAWHAVDLAILPGISAALAAASRAGAPLGHDFCILSLSDNLKPWEVIEKRLALAGEADLAMAFYNPISKARPWQLGRALDILRQHRAPETPVVLGRDIGRPAESLRVTTLGELTPEQVDMRTVVILGSSQTRCFPRLNSGDWVYTPRWYGTKPEDAN